MVTTDREIADKCHTLAQKAFADLVPNTDGPADMMTVVSMIMALAYLSIRNYGVDKDVEDTMATLATAAIGFVRMVSKEENTLQ